MGFRVLTVEEGLALPPLTEEEVERRRAIVRAVLDAADRRFEEHVRRGGHVMTHDEWQEFWDSRYDEDWDDDELTVDAPK